MKKFISGIVVITIFCSTIATAQEYKKFRVGIGAGCGHFDSEGFGYSLVTFVEPSYRIRDKISIGFRIESSFNLKGTSVSSLSLNAQYYFSAKKLRPFIGLGAGIFIPTSNVEKEMIRTHINNPSLFGFYPRIGVDYGHLSFSIDWNILGSAKTTSGTDGLLIDLSPFFPSSGTANVNYLALRAGIFIGGGRKRVN